MQNNINLEENQTNLQYSLRNKKGIQLDDLEVPVTPPVAEVEVVGPSWGLIIVCIIIAA